MTSSRCKKEAVGRSVLAFSLGGLVLWFCPACALDDYRLVDGGSEFATADAGTTLTNTPQSLDASLAGEAASCSPGSYRCDPAAMHELQTCDPFTTAGWVTVETCDSAEACDSDIGRCRVCTPGEHRCNSWQLQECNREGTDWVLLEECSAPENCDSRAVQCSTCLSGEAYCSGATLLSCNSNRDGYVATECASADECNIASMSCRACVPGEVQCNLQSLVRCSDAQTWEHVADCASAALCEASLQRHLDDPEAPVECSDPACEPGTFQCSEHDGRTLLGCPPDGSGFRAIAVCASAAACDANRGECITPVCTSGSYQCDGTALQLCSSDGTRWETLENCETAELCNTTQRACVACEPGGLQCSSNELQRCTDEAAWETLELCASTALCDAESPMDEAAGCIEPVCNVDEYRCNEERLEVCNAARDGFTVVATCESPDACNPTDGRCDVLACERAGTHRCRGAYLERCADDRRAWESVATCDDGSVCDLAIPGCAEQCPEQRFRCNGAVPEECVTNADGGIEWRATAPRCATEALCSADSAGASCSTPTCGGTLATFRCDPSQPERVQRCNAARDGWETDRTCADGTSCDPGPNQQGPAQCDVCSPGVYDCDGARLVRCEADGQRLTVLETCSDADHCSASDSGGYCLRCDAGQTRCDGGDLTTCSADRRGWVDSATCDPMFGCHTTPDRRDYCNVCAAANEARCKGDTLEVCDAAQRSITESLNCEFGCETIRSASDECRECAPGTSQCSTTESTQRLVCSSTGSWEAHSCGGDGDCYDAGSADYCGTCDPGDVFCFSSTELQECAMSGTPGAVTKCPTATPVCLSSRGQCVQCTPGTAARCTGTSGSSGREICADNGSWRAEACSGNTPACYEGVCKACFPGTNRCSGNDARRRDTCGSDGTWRASNCNTESVCWEGNCVECNPMTSGPRCTSSSGSGREVCIDGEWTAEACASNQVCVDGACLQCDPRSQSGECLPAEGSSAKRVCDAGTWKRADCADPTPLCRANGQCACAEGATRCSTSGMRQQCQSGVWVDSACVGSFCQAGECLECLADDDCDTDFPSCVDGACECDVGDERCTGSGSHQVCAGTTWNDAACMGTTPVCNPTTGSCVCRDGAKRCQAGNAEVCSGGAWLPRTPSAQCTPCTSNSNCSGTKPICDGVECVACNANCPSGTVCDASGACVECTAGNTSACENDEVCSTDNRCVECLINTDCEADEPICEANVCRDCESDTECDGSVCNTEDGSCEECTTKNCTGVCNLGVCVPCSDAGEDGGEMPCKKGDCVDGVCQ